MPLNYKKSPLTEAESASASIPYLFGLYDKVVYVSNEGDGTDGKTWRTAYTNFSDAYDSAGDETDNNTAILIGAGDYDFNVSGVFEVAKKLDIIGARRGKTRFLNTHASGTAVLKITNRVCMYNVRVCIATTAVDGLILSTGSHACRIERCKFTGMSATGAHALITIENAVKGMEFADCNIRGVAPHTTAIYVNNAQRCFFERMRILGGETAVHSAHASNTMLYFKDLIVDDFTTGLDLDEGTDLHFNEVTFHKNATNIATAAAAHGNTNFVGLHTDDLDSSVVPADLTGIAVATGVGVNTWGALVTLRAAVAATKPYYIVGLVVEFSTKEKYGVRLTSDAGSTYLWDGVIESGAANEAYRVVFTSPHLVYTGATLQAQSKDETGGDIAKIWVKIQEI